MGVRADHDALRAYALRAQATLAPALPLAIYDASKQTMRFAGGRTVELGNRPVQARLLAALVESHADGECEGLDADALIERVWPGEQIMPDAARNRLYVAISKLRKAGLGDMLDRDAAGRYSLVKWLEVEQRGLH